MQSNTGRNGNHFANDVDYDIGHLISVSSYHVINSPWASSLNYYSRSVTDNSKNTSPKNDSDVEQQKQNFLEVTPDAFRPVELPTTKTAMRTSSLTSLFAGKNSLSSSLKNSERRNQQYGNDDSVIAYPEIGVASVSRTASSSRLGYFNNFDTTRNNQGYEDDEDRNGQYGESRTGSEHYNQKVDIDSSWTSGVDHRDDDEVAFFDNGTNMSCESMSNDIKSGEQSQSCHSKHFGWTAAPTGDFQDIISVAKHHTDSMIKLNTSFEPVTKSGLEHFRNVSSPQLESTFNSQSENSSLRTTAERSLPSQNNFDPRNRRTHPPLVSAMRKKNISSTETAVAR